MHSGGATPAPGPHHSEPVPGPGTHDPLPPAGPHDSAHTGGTPGPLHPLPSHTGTTHPEVPHPGEQDRPHETIHGNHDEHTSSGDAPLSRHDNAPDETSQAEHSVHTGGTPGSPNKTPKYTDSGHQYKASMEKAEAWQDALRGTGPRGTSVWDTLKSVYNRVMGNPRLPARFGDDQTLPPHLQTLMHDTPGGFESAMGGNLGDLDRELLRATYDKDYYREPLMGYKSYDAFVQKHSGAASYRQIQELSPADRLQYLMTFGRQSTNDRQAAQQLERELRDRAAHDAQMADLESARARAQQQTQVAIFIYKQMLNNQLDEIRRHVNADDDFEQDSGSTPGTPGEGPELPEGGDHAATQHSEEPLTPPVTPPGTPSARQQDTMAALTRHQLVWEATRRSDPDLFGSLSKAYDRAMGGVTLPATFNDVTSLPEHLQNLLQQSGGVEGALRTNLGDLDRELLRATFDPTYYKEPLMGYAPYARFMSRYGDTATSAQIQRLSPPDRLQYLARHGQQSADEAATVQNRIQDIERSRQANASMQALAALREQVRQQEAINNAIAQHVLQQGLDKSKEALVDDDDL